MGVPKFFRWLSERYPLINQTVDLINVGPIIDNLYLDMNGIIHNCTHSDDSTDAAFSHLSENDMFGKVLQYIDHIFSVVRPRKLLFLAIDGVAPRAKMNQQRQRRFRAAETMAEENKDKPSHPDKAPFDSNCITPGTPFMGRLSEVIKFYIQRKIKDDQAWRDVEIIFSGHEVPGEGEHKILEYIRHQKSTANYNPNLSHCMYGLDADLIMLGLVSHEPHFSLIREDDVLKNNRTKSPIASFHFLHLSLLREYISMDFASLKLTLPSSCPWDLERIIDDFILLCFLVGNDFLPTLPTLNIAEGSLNRILESYKKILPSLGAYLTHSGTIDLEHLEGFFKSFCQGEENHFDIIPHGHEKLDRPRHHAPKAQRGQHGTLDPTNNRFRDLEGSTPADLASVLYAKRQADSDDDSDPESGYAGRSHAQRKPKATPDHLSSATPSSISESSVSGSAATTPSIASGEGSYNPLDHKVTAASASLDNLKLSVGSSEGFGLFGAESEEEPFDVELWKLTYYREKLDMDLRDTVAHDQLRTCYLEGLIWVYHYYFHGCISWSWFFPYHYAPLISDLVDISKYAPRIKFERSQPFAPYQQLLGVLPPKSAGLLPPAYQHLLLSPTSPLAPFIPETLEIDREGCKNEWEGVVLLPFMDEKVIVEASTSVPIALLTPAEVKSNSFGNAYTYKYDPTISATVASPQKELFDDLTLCCSEALVYHHPEAHSPSLLTYMEGHPPLLNSFKLLPGTHLGSNKPPTLPTLFSKKLNSSMQKNATRVLQRPAQFESLVVRITDFDEEEDAKRMAGRQIKYLRRDKRVDPVSLDLESLACQYHGGSCYVWPYNREAKVIAIMDEEGFYDANGNMISGKEAETKEWRGKVRAIDEFAEQQQAVDIGDTRCIFEVQYLNGVSRDLEGALKKQWSEKSTLVPFQCILETVPFGPDPRFIERPAPPLFQQYPMQSSVIYLPSKPGPMYGVVGTVTAHQDETSQISVLLDQVERIGPLKGTEILGPDFEKWYSARDVAKQVGISTQFLGRVSSSIILDDRTDLGLNLRFQGRGQQTLTYSRRIETVDRYTGQMNSWWEYSQKALDLILAYFEAFSDIFAKLVQSSYDNTSAESIFRESEAKEKAAAAEAKDEALRSSHSGESADEAALHAVDTLSQSSSDSEEEPGQKKKSSRRQGRVGPSFIRQKQMLEWLAHHRPSKSLRVICGTVGLDRANIMKIEAEMDQWYKTHPEPVNPHTRVIGVPRTQAFSPLPPLEVLHRNGIDAVGRQDFRLGERALFALSSGAVPFGTAGTIVTVTKTHVEVLLDVPVVGGTDLSGRCSHRRGISVAHGEIINMSSPFRKSETSLRNSGSNPNPAWSSSNSSDRIRNSQESRAPHGRSGGNHGHGNQGHGNQGQHGRQAHGAHDAQQGRSQGGRGKPAHHQGASNATPTPSVGRGAQRSGEHAKKTDAQGLNKSKEHHPKKHGDHEPKASTAKTVATRPPKAAHAKEAKPASSAKPPKATGAAAAAGKQVALGELFAPAGGAPVAQAASSAPEPIATIPGLTLDPQQLSFFNALSAGQGSVFAQQNMPALPTHQPMFAPGYAPMMQPPMGAPMTHVSAYMPQTAQAPIPSGLRAAGVDAIFNAPSNQSQRSVSIDALLPTTQAAPSDAPKKQ
jgi:5'-3' exoribonuclease 1